MKVRCFSNPDGSVRILKPNPKYRLEGESEDEFLARIAAKVVANDVSLRGLTSADLDDKDLPTDRTARDQWSIKQRAGRAVVEVDPAIQPRVRPS